MFSSLFQKLCEIILNTEKEKLFSWVGLEDTFAENKKLIIWHLERNQVWEKQTSSWGFYRMNCLRWPLRVVLAWILRIDKHIARIGSTERTTWSVTELVFSKNFANEARVGIWKNISPLHDRPMQFTNNRTFSCRSPIGSISRNNRPQFGRTSHARDNRAETIRSKRVSGIISGLETENMVVYNALLFIVETGEATVSPNVYGDVVACG